MVFALTWQIPWFCGPEFETLQRAPGKDKICAAAIYLDKVVIVVAVEAPKTVLEVQQALLEETRAMRSMIGGLARNIQVGSHSDRSAFNTNDSSECRGWCW